MNKASAGTMVLKPGPDNGAKPVHSCTSIPRTTESMRKTCEGLKERALLSFSIRPQKPVSWLPFLTSRSCGPSDLQT